MIWWWFSAICSAAKDERFGCSITPTAEGLARTKEFVAESNRSPLRPGHRDRWLDELRGHLGKQTIEVNGIDPRTRVGRVMVEADYRMKLVGLGLEDGVQGVPSYLSTIRLNKDGSVPPLDVLRWWFTLNYMRCESTAGHDAFELRGQGVKVLSENELLTATGQQVHTGQSSNFLNDQFAHNFTAAFSRACGEISGLCGVAKHLRFGVGRCARSFAKAGREGRLASHVLRRSAAICGGAGRRPARGQYGNQPPHHRRRAHSGGRQRRRVVRSHAACALRRDRNRLWPPARHARVFKAKAEFAGNLVVGLERLGIGSFSSARAGWDWPLITIRPVLADRARRPNQGVLRFRPAIARADRRRFAVACGDRSAMSAEAGRVAFRRVCGAKFTVRSIR